MSLILKGNIKSFLILLGGSSFSQILIIITLPILSSSYPKESFAYLSLFTAICSSIYPIVTGRLNYALIGEENNIHAKNIFNFSALYIFLTSFVFGVTIWVIYYLCDIKIVDQNFFSHIALYVFFYSLFEIIISDINRLQKYLTLSFIKFFRVVFLISLYFFFINNFAGLVQSQIISLGLISFFYILSNKKLSYRSLYELIQVFQKFKVFILKNSIAASLNNLTLSVPIFYIGSIYGLEVLGAYSLFNMIAFAPLSMVSKSIAQINNGNLISLKNEKIIIRPYFNNIFKNIVFLSLFIIPIYLIFNNYFFDIFFDEDKWFLTREITNILIFGIAVQFGATSLSTTIETLRRINRSTKIKFLMIFSSIIVHMICYLFKFDFLDYILTLTLEKIIIYLTYYYQINLSVNEFDNKL